MQFFSSLLDSFTAAPISRGAGKSIFVWPYMVQWFTPSLRAPISHINHFHKIWFSIIEMVNCSGNTTARIFLDGRHTMVRFKPPTIHIRIATFEKVFLMHFIYY